MELVKHDVVYLKPDSINKSGLIPTSIGLLEKTEDVYVLTETDLRVFALQFKFGEEYKSMTYEQFLERITKQP